MEQERLYMYYALSLVWMSLIFAVIGGMSNIVELTFVDFVHGNSHRPQSNAVEMMWTFTPLSSMIAIIGCFLVFSLPQIFQACLHKRLFRSFRKYQTLTIVSAITVFSILTWYCWEYLTPTDSTFSVGDDWTPYQHGITLQRYLDALAFQTPVSLYSLIYCKQRLVRSSTKTIIIFGFIVAVLIGAIYGHYQAEQQYKFL